MAKKPNYFQNVANEVNQSIKAYRDTLQMSNTSGPGTDARANALRAMEDKQTGQLFGAILQGRRYDSKGKQIKK
jgi:hypothetical protein